MNLKQKKVSIYFVFFIILFDLLSGCCQENNTIPLFINNLKIEKNERESGEKKFKVQYKDTQTLECEIEKQFLVIDDLKIKGIGAYYDGAINLYLTTNHAWVEEEFKIIPYKINFELSCAGLNKRKIYFKLNLDGEEVFTEVK